MFPSSKLLHTDTSIFSKNNDNSNTDMILRMLDEIKNGQYLIFGRMGELELTSKELQKDVAKMSNKMKEIQDTQEQMDKQFKKINSELDRVSQRTACIKELSVNTAAHTLNTARKIHGAQSVFDPVKNFKDGGHRDWLIQPVSMAASYSSMSAPTMFPVAQMNAFGSYYGRSVEPIGVLRSYKDYETPQPGSRTPVYGNRTPSYENLQEESPRLEKPTKSRFEPYKNAKSNRTTSSLPSCSSMVPGSPDSDCSIIPQ